MSSGWLIFLIAVGVVAFFVVGMSLTIIFKGHYMESEIGENRHMKARGIRCASQQLARGGGRVARRFLGGRRGVLRRKLLVLYGRLLRRTRSGRFPVGRRPARSGSATVPLRRLLFCPFVGRFWRKAASSRPVASVLAPVFVFYEVCRPGRRVWNAARAATTHEKLRRHPR